MLNVTNRMQQYLALNTQIMTSADIMEFLVFEFIQRLAPQLKLLANVTGVFLCV
jgi:hypothetical protein